MRLVAFTVALCVIAPEVNAQSLSLPKTDGITGFYRMGQASIKGPWRKQPIAPCRFIESSFPACGWGFEAVYQMTSTKRPIHWRTEIAVGYDFVNFQASKLDDSGYDLFGSMQTLPSITIYENWDLFTREHVREPWGELRRVVSPWSAYAAIGTGIVVLKNVRAYDSQGTVYTLSGETWGFTPALGISRRICEEDEQRGGLNLFLEASYEFRNFPSISYGLPKVRNDVLPANLPRNISSKGLVINFGFEVTFPKKKL